MKKLILKTTFVFTLFTTVLLQSGLAMASNPAKNYWVVETNLKQRTYSIIRFYNAADELIYEEKLKGVYLNIARAKHVKRLNLALERVTEDTLVADYKNMASQKNIVASLYRR